MEKNEWVSAILQTQNEKDFPKLDIKSKGKVNKRYMTPESLALATWWTVMTFTR